MPILKFIPTNSTGNLGDYLERQKPDSELPRVLHEFGQHCRVDTAKADFRALREEHGTEGLMRKVPGKYVEPDDPATATHVKVGKNWREARADETATHVRIEPDPPEEKAAEGLHIVISFGLDEVDPNDPEACARAVDWVRRWVADDYQGAQAKGVAHGDAKGSEDARERGEGGKFHVHVAMNLTVHSEFEVGGRTFKPGQRLAGPATHIDQMRERFNKHLDEHCREYGLQPQKLKLEDSRQVRRTDHDFHVRQRGGMSDQDKTREAVEAALAKMAQDPDAVAALDPSQRKLRLKEEVAAIEVAGTKGIELKLRTVKSTGEVKLRSYEVPGRKKPVGAKELGDRYKDAGLDEQLQTVADGKWKTYERPHAGPPKQIERLEPAEVEALQAQADEWAQAELDRQQREAEHADPAEAEHEAKAAEAAKAAAARRAEQNAAEWAWLTEEYAPEVKLLGDALAEDYRSDHPGAPDDEVDLIVTSRLKAAAASGRLEPQLVEAREHLERAQVAREAARESEPAEEPGVPGSLSSLPTTASSGVAASPPGTGAKPKRRVEKQVRLAVGDPRKDLDLLIVPSHKTHNGRYTDRGYLDVQVLAGQPSARGQSGYHLSVRDRADGHQVVTHQYKAAEYDRIREVGTPVELDDGRTAYVVRGNVQRSSKDHTFHVNANSVRPSQRQVDSDVLTQQRQSEDAERSRQTEQRVAEAKPEKQEQSAAEKAYEAFSAAEARSLADDGPTR